MPNGFDPLTADPRSLVRGGFSQPINTDLAKMVLAAQLQDAQQRQNQVVPTPSGLRPPAPQGGFGGIRRRPGGAGAVGAP